MKKVVVLGSTGSVGESTLDVISRHPDLYDVFALTAHSKVDKIFQQCLSFTPQFAVMADETAAQQLSEKLKNSASSETIVLSGESGLIEVASHSNTDYVMAAIVGAAGLLPTLAAAQKGKRVLLANKEALVMSGKLFMDQVAVSGAELLPIDSEHNAIFQCLPESHDSGLNQLGVSQILLTASGGPFRTFALDQLKNISPRQACAHPNWDMGPKISVDSATMMNKGLEIIEARWLFNASIEQIQVVVHPQSVIHSMVQYVDGSVIAQLGNPDMRTPIAHALAWPNRIPSGVEALNMVDIAKLDFEAPDFERFPCLQLAYDALEKGGTATTILNAANEVAVDAFLNETISFLQIPKVILSTIDDMNVVSADSIEIILSADKSAREFALENVNRLRT